MSYTDRGLDGSYLREDGYCERCATLERDLARERERTNVLREAVEAWIAARERNIACHEEFGWNPHGDDCCEEWQSAEDQAAGTLIALAASLPAVPAEDER